METLDLVGISAVIGVLLPYLTSLLKNIGRTWPTQWVKIMAFALAGASALIVVGAQEGWTSLDINMILGSFTVIYALAQTTYKGLIGGTKVEQILATTLTKG
jgi:hypothetical protein